MITTIEVEARSRTYKVFVGPDARHCLPDLIPQGVRRVAIVTQEKIRVDLQTNLEQRIFYVGDGEAAKCLDTVNELCQSFAEWGLSRGDIIIAHGGGVVTDVVGFAAAIYHRGMDLINVATTLLGQVDAAIGGKTGVNLPQGKNLIGSFWQPRAVICDTDLLQTLNERQLRSGYGEVAKYELIDGGQQSWLGLDLPTLVGRCVAIKAGFVKSDETEDTLSIRRLGHLGIAKSRALLNYGHALAHALETNGHYDLLHGEAVAMGLVFAARLARRLGRISDERVDEHCRVVEQYGLETMVPPTGYKVDELIQLIARDKKAMDATMTFVLDGRNGVEVVRGVDRADVEAALKETIAS